MKHIQRAAVTTLALVATTLVATPATAAERVTLSKGHVDAVDVRYEGGALSLTVHDDTVSPGVTRDPADVTFRVLPGAATPVPDGATWAFLGEAGSTVYLLPQVQDANLLWPGWNTTGLGRGVFAGDAVTISLVGVTGPGDVTLFDVNSLGSPNIRFRSADGLPDRLSVPVHTHAHAAWVFSAAGDYTLQWQADATLPDGTTLSTGPVDYRFSVGDAQTRLEITGMAEEHQPGDTVTLTAVQTPQGAGTTYQWYAKRLGDADFAPIAGETGATYRFTATRELNATDYQVRLADGTASEPVTLWVAFPPEHPSTSQTITASIGEDGGALVISVDPDDRTVVLPAAALSPAGDRWESTGGLRPVTVTDTRTAQPGWAASGQVAADFTSPSGTTLSRGYLGWAPLVSAQSPNQQVTAGPVIAPYQAGQGGIGNSATLASAPAGAGRGTARLGADLRLSVPTETAAGTYTATLTLTAI